MTAKPTTADGYPPGQVARVRATCLYLATKLGDLMPEMVVVGGLVPSLLIDQQNLPQSVTPYDAYDLFYLLRSYGAGVGDVAAELRPWLDDPAARRAMEYLGNDFSDIESIGPRRTAIFLYGRPDAETQADAVGFVRRLLTECGLGEGGDRSAIAREP